MFFIFFLVLFCFADAVMKRHEKATAGHLGQAINSKLAELRFQLKKKETC